MSAKPRRLGLYVPWALFVVVCVGWSIAWFAAKDAAMKALDAQIARVNAAGADVGYARAHASGFPLHMTLTLEEAHASASPARLRVDAQRLPISINLSNPRHLIIGLADGVRWTGDDRVTHFLTAARGEMSVRFTADNTLARASLDLEKAHITHGGDPPTDIAALLVHVRPDPRGAMDAQIVVEATDWAGPTPFAALNAMSPFGHFRAAIVATDGALLAGRGSLRGWAGTLRIERLDVAYAQTQVTGEGELRLDAAHRPDGVLRVTPAGAQQVELRASGGWWTFAGLRVAPAKPLYSSE